MIEGIAGPINDYTPLASVGQAIGLMEYPGLQAKNGPQETDKLGSRRKGDRHDRKMVDENYYIDKGHPRP